MSIIEAVAGEVDGELAMVIPGVSDQYGYGFTNFSSDCIGIYIILENYRRNKLMKQPNITK